MIGTADSLERSGNLGRVDQAQRGLDHLALPPSREGWTHGAPHRMRRDQRPRQVHRFGVVRKRFDIDRNGPHPCRFESPRNVPDRHVAHRSDGYQKHDIGSGGLEPVRPIRCGVIYQPGLSTGPDERVGDLVERSDDSLLFELSQSSERE